MSENPRSNTRRAEVGTAGLVWWDKIEAWCLGWRENEAVVLVAQREEVEAAHLGWSEVEAVEVAAQREDVEAPCLWRGLTSTNYHWCLKIQKTCSKIHSDIAKVFSPNDEMKGNN